MEGIRATIYIDDGRILAEEEEKTAGYLARTYEVLEKAGWQLERKKSDRIEDVGKVKKYLGFIIDTGAMMVTAPDEKISKIKRLIGEAIKRKSIEVRELSKILGIMVSMHFSHGSMSRIYTRSGYIYIESHVAKK